MGSTLDLDQITYNNSVLSDEERSRLKSALFLNARRPSRYRLDYRQSFEGGVVERRLVDKITGEELLPWTIVQYFGALTYLPDEKVEDF